MQIATMTGDDLTIAAGDYRETISAPSIARNWNALSHFPEKRARHELSDLAARLNAFAARVNELIDQGGAIDADLEIAQFAKRHVSLTRRAWAMDSRCMSWFIVGPSKFPTARNQKRMDSADKARAAIRDHASAAMKALKRKAFPYGAPGEAIRAANPDAPELIREKVEKLERQCELMKTVNTAIRSAKNGDESDMIRAVMSAVGWSEKLAAKIVQPDFAGRRGFPAYELSNARAEIRRLKNRIASLEADRARGAASKTVETRLGKIEIKENSEAARIQIMFDGKPEASARAVLKSNGFRWAPSVGAWQRHLNQNGRWAAERVIAALSSANECGPA